MIRSVVLPARAGAGRRIIAEAAAMPGAKALQVESGDWSLGASARSASGGETGSPCEQPAPHFGTTIVGSLHSMPAWADPEMSMSSAEAFASSEDVTHWIAGAPYRGAAQARRQPVYHPASGAVAP